MVMNEAGIVVGRQSFNYAEQMNNQRVSRQNRRSKLESKEGWEARKALLQVQNEVYEEELLYSAAIDDFNHETASPLGRFVEEEESWKPTAHPHDIIPQNWDGDT
ncbi:uncharacterized protein TNCV_324191 [Trichonephila clavipes]|nr:uncharacterized protein TNCV_324191 [Trichonephila clavipes]